MWLAPGALTPSRWLLTLLGTAGTVGAANALNCYLERDVDRVMARTRNRPLPAGRMDPPVALAFAVALAGVALPILALGSNLLTTGLGLLALVIYVGVYTPLKPHTDAAMLVGAATTVVWLALTVLLDVTWMVGKVLVTATPPMVAWIVSAVPAVTPVNVAV